MSRFQLGGLSPGSNRCPPPCSASALHHVLPAQCHVPPARYAMHFQCVAKLRQLATPTFLTFLSPTIIIITSVHSFFRCLLITTVLNRCVWLTASLWIAGVDATRRARPLCFGLTQMWNKGGSTRCCYIRITEQWLGEEKVCCWLLILFSIVRVTRFTCPLWRTFFGLEIIDAVLINIEVMSPSRLTEPVTSREILQLVL